MRKIIALAIAFSAIHTSTAQASSENAVQKDLRLLEQQYFGTTFDSDNDNIRTERIEKLTLGALGSGDISTRVKSLKDSAGESSDNTANVETASSLDANQPEQMLSEEQDSPHGSTTNSNSNAAASESYPRVTALESAILNQTYTTDQLSERLARMEVKAFGKASSNDDFGERADLLQQYVEKTLHKKWVSAESSSEQQEVDDKLFVKSPTQGGSPVQAENPAGNSQTEYPRLTFLESAILGTTFPSDTPLTRLNRLEMNCFGHPSYNSDLSLRTEALETYADKKLHKKPLLDQERSRQAASQSGESGPGHAKQIATMLGTTLLGMAGLPIIPSMMPSNQRRKGQAANGSHSSNQAEAQNGNAQAKIRQDDPIISSSTAPPPTAKLNSKVGWCEMRTFGQIHPEMHLPERLTQLNRTLNFAPNKAGLALMDDVPAMIKAAELRQKPITPISANTNTID